MSGLDKRFEILPSWYRCSSLTPRAYAYRVRCTHHVGEAMPRSEDGLTRGDRRKLRRADRDAVRRAEERGEVDGVMQTRGLTLSINDRMGWKTATVIVAHGHGLSGQKVIRCVGDLHRLRAMNIIASYAKREAEEKVKEQARAVRDRRIAMPPRIDWPAGVVDIRRAHPRPADDDEPIGIVGRA